ncbi:MAG: beta-ketoacyl synthase chain length factor [Chromatiales bacterium]|nr:beta-ketoacyl synthase chain length factor [Gammaproteobacteria bacterium]MBW6477290.1 beta-ketoacyl synthase chain length factor [Chromatiales bacterium]
MIQATVMGLGLAAPGLDDWAQALPCLRGEQPWPGGALSVPSPTLLPANERRRTTPLIRLAMGVAEQACAQAGIAPAELACVFASAEGDTLIVERLCEALSLPEKPISPTQFHNSVHNAPAGYWAIAAQARQPSTSISAGPASFAAGLLEALSYLQAEQAPVLLIAYDTALPLSLAPHGDVQQSFGCAMVLAPQDEGLAQLACLGLASGKPSTLAQPEWEVLRRANPAAEALPLLAALARGESAQLALRYLDEAVLQVQVG